MKKKFLTLLIFNGFLLISVTSMAKNLFVSETIDLSQEPQESSEPSGTVPNLDVIIAFDNSDSMNFSVSTLEFYINVYFYQVLNPANYNTRIILISDDSTDSEGICLPAPLGSGECPADENLPNYQHVTQNISGNNALSSIIATYDLWDQSLRPNSKRAVIVISDGNADMSAEAFISGLTGLDSDFTGFQFHAIGLIPVDGCQNPADFSTVYKQLTDLTNGLLYSIYLEFFDGVWNLIAQNIIDSIFQSEFECIGH